MSKNKFGIPGILFNPTPSPVPGGNVIGGGTAQGGQGNNDLPMSYDDFCNNQQLWAFYDQQSNGTPNQADWDDYGMWWADCDYSLDQWKALGYSEEDFNTFVLPYQW